MPQDLARTAELLHAERPQLTPLELDNVKITVLGRVTTRRPGRPARQKGLLMKSRLALTSLIAVGILLSGTGATLAISGISDSGNAGVAQYGDNDGDGGQDLAPASDEGGPGGDDLAGDDGDVAGDDGDVAGDDGDVAGDVVDDTDNGQAPQQLSVQDGDGTLPFTGFLAIPLLIGGVALTFAGTALRRRSSRDRSEP